MARVLFENVSKVFDKTVTAVDAFDLEIRDKEFVVLVGPSGCGKSTTLRMIAGLELPTTGNIYIGDRLVNDVLPKDRDIAMVFQNYALYPHMTVYENIAYGLRLRKYPKRVIDEKVKEAARESGVSQVRLYVDKTNRPAQEVYHRLGMHESHYLMFEENA